MTVTEFRTQLCDSGLMDETEADALYRDYASANAADAGNVQEWSKHLVHSKRATMFQVSALFVKRPPVLVFGRFEILDKLASGGMGDVYRAIDRTTATSAVIKVLPPNSHDDEELVKRFHRETKLLLSLQHPNIVCAIDAGEVGGCQYLAMEYVEGADMGRLMKHRGPMAVSEACEFLMQASQALAYAHDLGVVHRDVKPTNFMLDQNGRVKVLDLGLARILGDDNPLTHTGSVLGSVDYMAPEQASESKDADRRADVYALGCTLFYLLTGRLVYEGKTITQKIVLHQSAPIPSLQAACPAAPPRLDLLFKRMLAKNPRDRIGNMNEVIKAVERLRRDGSISTADLMRYVRANADGATEYVGVNQQETMVLTPRSPLKAPAPRQPAATIDYQPTAFDSDRFRRKRWPVVVGAFAALASVAYAIGRWFFSVG